MQMTKSFHETVEKRLSESKSFRRALLSEALGHSSKTLMRMLGPTGNPQLRNFFEMITYLQKIEGSQLAVVDRSAA